MTASNPESTPSIGGKLLGRAALTGAICTVCAAILWMLFPRWHMIAILAVAVVFACRLAIDVYLFSFRIVIDDEGLRIGSQRLAHHLTDNQRRGGVKWKEIARVSELPWSFRQLLSLSKRKSVLLSIGGEDLRLTTPFQYSFFATLRRFAGFSSDLFIQSGVDGTVLLIPRASLNRQEHQKLARHLLEVERNNPGTLLVWFGAVDARSPDQVKEIVAIRENHLRTAVLEEMRGFDSQRLQRWKKARDHYMRALEIYRQEKEVRHIATCARSLAKSCAPLAEFRLACELYEEALDLTIKSYDLHGQADCHNELSHIYMETRWTSGRQDALDHLDEAIKIFVQLGNILMAANAWGNKGLIYQTLARLSDQIDEMWWQSFSAAHNITILRKQGLHIDGDSWLDCALACHRQALSLVSKLPTKEKRVVIAEARQIGCIAEICWKKGKFEQAVQHYEEQQSLLDSIGSGGFSQDLSISGLSRINISLDASGNVIKPEALNKAIQLLGHAVLSARQLGDEMEMILAHSRRGMAFRKMGNLRAACRDLEQAVEIIEKIRPNAGPALARAVLLHEHQDVYGYLIETLLELQLREPDKDWAARAFEYCERAKCRRLVEVYLSASTNKAVALPIEVSEARLVEATAIEYCLESGKSEVELERLAGHVSSTTQKYDWDWLLEKDISEQMLPDSIAVDFLPCKELLNQGIAEPDTLVLQVFAREERISPVDSCDALLAIIPATRKGLGEAICYRKAAARKLFRAARNLKKYIGSAYDPENPQNAVAYPFGTELEWIEKPEEQARSLRPIRSAEFDPDRSGARRLYSALIGVPQIQQILNSAHAARSISRIVIVPFGSIFNDLPFCALHDGRSFLIQQYEVVVCPSLQWLANIRTSKNNQNGSDSLLKLISGDFVNNDNEPKSMDVGLISEKGVITRYGGQDGNSAGRTWRELFDSIKDYQRIMIVAHGEQWPTPLLHFGAKDKQLRSFPANWDLTLKDIYSSVDLDCNLLALLACFAQQQNSPFSGEWESMTTAFLAKGARSILAAHYAVHVGSANILLNEVFKGLASGESVAPSLRRAQCLFINEKRFRKFNHPYYWAMTCIGHTNKKDSRQVEGDLAEPRRESLALQEQG